MMFSVFTLFVLVGSCACMEKIKYRKCQSGNTLSAILMDPCYYVENAASSPDRCTIYQGTTVKVNAIFIAPFSSSDLEIEGSATIRGVRVPLPETGSNPCQGGGIIPGCPVKKDKMYILSLKFNVLRAFSIGSMDIQYSIRDKRTKKHLGCAIIGIVIRKPVKEL